MNTLVKVLGIGCLLLMVFIQSCEHIDLDEVPMADLGVEHALSTKQGFESFITGLHIAARDEMIWQDDALTYYIPMFAGTDVATFAHDGIVRTDYNNLLQPTVNTVTYVWNWAYRNMVNRANTVIAYGNDPSLFDIWDNEEERNAIVAEARFFRGYTYNMLANLYGGVPIVDTVITTPKTDFVRATREEVLEFARQDLEFASEWLPLTVQQEGRIVKAAADHLLSEVYISLGLYDQAVEAADRVIDSGLYRLMTERFGSEMSQPGDVFSDLFRDGNQNRNSGNRESIYVWQFEDMTPGGQGNTRGNPRLRYWGARYFQEFYDPDGVTANIVVDSLGRGVAHIRPNTWYLYDLWRSDWDNDIRNSRHNIRRDFYYTNPASAYFGQKILREHLTTHIDTMRTIYPIIRKVEGNVGTMTHTAISWSGRTYQDVMVFRLAETYLLRAEAYFRMGNLQNAAEDINEVRGRANATLIGASDVTEDYILDERARELTVEEPRRRTLVRMGRLVDRVREYNMRPETQNSIQDFHQWWPIPQTAIDANLGATLEQNPGY